jgi:hypothetical protein
MEPRLSALLTEHRAVPTRPSPLRGGWRQPSGGREIIPALARNRDRDLSRHQPRRFDDCSKRATPSPRGCGRRIRRLAAWPERLACNERAPKRRRSREVSNFRDDSEPFRAVRSILMEAWNPLGVSSAPGAANEYNRQVLVLVEMFEAGKEVLEITDFLERSERELVGQDAEREICRQAAEILVALRSKG